MKDSAKEFLREGGKTILTPVFAAFGGWVLAKVTGTGDTVRKVWESDPKAVVIWTIGALALGIVIGWSINDGLRLRSSKTKEREMLNLIRGLSPQLLSIVRQAYDDGEVMTSPLDPHVTMLANMGILGTAPIGIIGMQQPWLLQPDVRILLDRHWDEVPWPEGRR